MVSYKLTELRNGTGFPRGARFVDKKQADALMWAVEYLIGDVFPDQRETVIAHLAKRGVRLDVLS